MVLDAETKVQLPMCAVASKHERHIRFLFNSQIFTHPLPIVASRLCVESNAISSIGPLCATVEYA